MYRVYRKSDDAPVDRPYNVVSAAQAVGYYVAKVLKEKWRREEFYALEVADQVQAMPQVKAKTAESSRTKLPTSAPAPAPQRYQYPARPQQTEFAFQ